METNNTALIAINKWMFFCYNYPYDFIERVWGKREQYNLTDHLYGKFDAYYESVGAYGVIAKFYANLDNSNKVKLMQWVMDNYKGEQKLNLV